MVQFQRLTRNLFLPYTGKRTPSAAATVQVSHALPAVRFSCLLRGRGASFQYGVAAGKGFLCAQFWGVQICDYSLAVHQHGLEKTHSAGCTLSEPCKLHCNYRSGYLKTEHTESLFLLRRHLGNWPRGPAGSMRSELLVAHGICRCWRCMLCPCKVSNKFLVNFWNCAILLCISCKFITHVPILINAEFLLSNHNSQQMSSTWTTAHNDTFGYGLSYHMEVLGAVVMGLTSTKKCWWSVYSLSLTVEYAGDFKCTHG